MAFNWINNLGAWFAERKSGPSTGSANIPPQPPPNPPNTNNGNGGTPMGPATDQFKLPDEDPIKPNTAWYFWAVVTYVLFCAGIVVAGTAVHLNSDDSTTLLGFEFSAGVFVATILSVLLIARAIQYVPTNYFGGITLFGRPILGVKAGPVFVPWPFGELVKLTKLQITSIQRQYPADPEQVFQGMRSDVTVLPEVKWPDGVTRSMVHRILVTTRAPTKNELKDLGPDEVLAAQTTVAVSFYVRFKIVHFFCFLVRIGSIAEADRQMRDTGEAALSEMIADMTTNQVLAKINEINSKLEDKIRALVYKKTHEWGIEVDDADMLAPDIGKTMSEALVKIPGARADAATTRIAAEATRFRLEQEGEGTAKAIASKLKAENDGFKDRIKDLGATADAILALETAKQLGDKTVVLGLENTIKGLASAFKGAGDK